VIRERVLKLGKSTPLVGILSEPPTGVATENRPAILLLNSGILHRVGACRLYVRLARRLAAEGYTVVRFDFSGIGDSEVRKDDLPFEASAVLELKETMDQISRTRGISSYVPMGLCSGADMALEIAKVDDRVKSLGLLDLWVYRTPGYYLRRYGPKLLSIGALSNAVRVRLQQMGQRMDEEAPEYLDLPTYVREFPPRPDATRALADLVERGVRLRCIFTGGQAEDYNYQGQFRAAFSSVKFGSLLEESYLAKADHIFTNLAHQEWVINEISTWLDRTDAP
jgi:pimeloyl-ACP methyl ester carboxylesterase